VREQGQAVRVRQLQIHLAFVNYCYYIDMMSG